MVSPAPSTFGAGLMIVGKDKEKAGCLDKHDGFHIIRMIVYSLMTNPGICPYNSYFFLKPPCVGVIPRGDPDVGPNAPLLRTPPMT